MHCTCIVDKLCFSEHTWWWCHQQWVCGIGGRSASSIIIRTLRARCIDHNSKEQGTTLTNLPICRLPHTTHPVPKDLSPNLGQLRLWGEVVAGANLLVSCPYQQTLKPACQLLLKGTQCFSTIFRQPEANTSWRNSELEDDFCRVTQKIPSLGLGFTGVGLNLLFLPKNVWHLELVGKIQLS